MTLQGRVALVTGGAIRVGQAIAQALAKRHAHVVITYRSSKADAEKTTQELQHYGVSAEALQADQSKSADVRRVIKKIEDQFGQLDVLVNSAAIFERTPIATLTEADWDKHINTNLKGPFLFSLEASKLMLKKGGGKIVNIADWAGERPYTDYLPYCVSKAGVMALTKSLAKELAPKIQVITIAPGPILPPPDMSRADQTKAVAKLPMGRWGSPHDIANAVLFALEGTDFITGTTIYVDGGRSVA